MNTHYLSDPKAYLQREYEIRHLRNPSYSWRSFARDLRLSPSMLSEFLKGRYGLSRGKALDVARTLQLTDSEGQHFADLLEAEFHRARYVREQARLRVAERLNQDFSTTSPFANDAYPSLSVVTRITERDLPRICRELNDNVLQVLQKYRDFGLPDAVYGFHLQTFPVMRLHAEAETSTGQISPGGS